MSSGSFDIERRALAEDRLRESVQVGVPARGHIKQMSLRQISLGER